MKTKLFGWLMVLSLLVGIPATSWAAFNDDFSIAVPTKTSNEIPIAGGADLTAVNSTTWVISDKQTITNTITISSNVELKFNRGGMLTIPTGVVLTINGSVSAGLYQIFNCVGTGKVILTGERYVEWFGASPTVTNNTPYLDKAVTSLNGGNRGTLVLTQQYPITTQWTVANLTNFTLDFRGGRLYASGCNGMGLTSALYGNIKQLDISYAGALGSGWAGSYSGLVLDSVKDVDLDIKDIRSFYKGLAIEPTGTNGVSYMSNIRIGMMYCNKYDIYMATGKDSWITELSFYGGRFTLESTLKAATSGSYCVYMHHGGSNSINNIKMYSPCFEGKHNGIRGDVTEFSLFSPRFEAIDDNFLEYLFLRSVFMAGFGGFDVSKLHLSEQSRNNLFLGKDKDSGMTILTETNYGGLGFIDTYGRNVIQELYAYSQSNALRLKDASGEIQVLNKSFAGDSVPTSGTYVKGAVVWNASPAQGESIGWMCSVSGTQGTLNGITASGIDKELHIHVNKTTGLYVGAYITFAGISGAKQIQGIVGTTVYLTVALDDTFDNKLVSYYPATFRVINALLN